MTPSRKNNLFFLRNDNSKRNERRTSVHIETYSGFIRLLGVGIG